MDKFPDNFFWGTSTSAYQVEGNNKNSDWWEWENRIGLKETSGAACRHYDLFREDFDLAKQLNHNAHRFSVEWSRVEPQEGKFSSEEIAHYREVALALKERGIEPIVTLHHFTNPQWLAKLGGWENRKASKYFLRYVEKMVSSLRDKVRFWITINEPLVYAHYAYNIGIWPPQKKSFLKALSVRDNLAAAHIESYHLIHNIYQKSCPKPPLVSIAQHIRLYEPYNSSLQNKFIAYYKDKLFNFSLIEKLFHARSLDFIGITYYTRELVDAHIHHHCEPRHRSWPDEAISKKNSLGWDIYPEGLFNLLLRLNKFHLPIFILENGICTANDDERWNFIHDHLKNIYFAIQQGVNIIGYLYWSLMDNYEWDEGFGHRFGLIGIDYTTYKRTIRESAKKFASVYKTGTIE